MKTILAVITVLAALCLLAGCSAAPTASLATPILTLAPAPATLTPSRPTSALALPMPTATFTPASPPTAAALSPAAATPTPPLPTVALPLATLTAPALAFLPANIPACPLAPLVAPTRPATIPEDNALDKTTNLHMTGKPSALDPATYRLRITGLVQRPLSLSLDELRCLPKIGDAPELVCPGVFMDIASWAGASLKTVLDLAGIKPGAKSIKLISADYQMVVQLKDALKEENILAYEWRGQPLPILHGFPVRAVFPSLYGYNWVKWLVEIKVE